MSNVPLEMSLVCNASLTTANVSGSTLTLFLPASVFTFDKSLSGRHVVINVSMR